MLSSTPISRCLEKKLSVFGFEVPDLICIFMLLSILNFFFGHSEQKILLVWLPPALLAMALRLGKHNRPERFLTHWLRFQFAPGVWSAFSDPSSEPQLRIERKQDGNKGAR